MYEWFKRSLQRARDGTGDRFQPVIPLIAGVCVCHPGGARPSRPRSADPSGARALAPPRSCPSLGSGGRVLATAFKIPFDVVKQRLEVQGALRLKNDQTAYKGMAPRALARPLRNACG